MAGQVTCLGFSNDLAFYNRLRLFRAMTQYKSAALSPYAMCGTDVVPIALRACYAMSGTDLVQQRPYLPTWRPLLT
eukprot:3594902-Rhodomonas_salina.1